MQKAHNGKFHGFFVKKLERQKSDTGLESIYKDIRHLVKVFWCEHEAFNSQSYSKLLICNVRYAKQREF